MNRLPVSAAIAAALAPALLAACDASPVHSAAAGDTSPAAPSTPASPSAAPATVAGKLTATCIAGLYNETQNEFYTMSGLVHGTDIATGNVIAEAYQLTLTSRATATVKVAGFSVAFYAGSRKLASVEQALPVAVPLGAGQTEVLTEHPWATSVAGQGASVGPFAAGEQGAVNTAATCRLVRWDE